MGAQKALGHSLKFIANRVLPVKNPACLAAHQKARPAAGKSIVPNPHPGILNKASPQRDTW